MTFNIALSGLNAASADLQITGNNIANASTIGFKSARAEFADVYASSLLGSGSVQVGSGVKLSSAAQQFDQGTISFTNNSLDLAIDGNGFFVLSDNGSRAFTRAGAFGVDEQGFIVANNGSRVQGFTANSAGTLSGILGDMQITTSNLAPLQSTLVQAAVNVDARSEVLSKKGSSISTLGSSIGVAQTGIPVSTPTSFPATGAPAAFDFSAATASASFDIVLSGAGSNNGTATITLSSSVTDVTSLVNDIRPELLASGIGVDVREDPANAGQLEFFSTVSGEPSSVVINNYDVSNAGVTQADVDNALNLAGGSVPGIAAVANGYGAQTVDVVQPDGSILTITTTAGDSAADIASQFSSTNVVGVSATASTVGTLTSAGFDNASGTMAVALNGIALGGTTLADLATSINNTSGFGTVTALIDSAGDLVVTDLVGNDLVFSVTAGGGADSVAVQGSQGVPVTISTTGNPAAAVGGSVDLTLGEGVVMNNPSPIVTNVFGLLDPSEFVQFELNTFDPSNQETYNAATSLSIFDSLGNPHVLSLYFVKERFTPGVAGEEENRWSMYTLIDGKDVGDPDPNLTPPANTLPTQAKFAVQFNQDGTLNPAGTDTILVSNWTPLDTNGNPNGAIGAQNLLSGGGLPLADPPASSNFELRLGESTQFGSNFAVNSLDQNGFTTGELSGLDIDDAGIVSARFTNGQNQTLGQIAIADFTNTEGLRAVGDTSWIQTNDSGEPVIAAPGSGSLGAITSGALEESNVDLSEQLVQLIIAQRNFQANARTISTSDEITQTIINL